MFVFAVWVNTEHAWNLLAGVLDQLCVLCVCVDRVNPSGVRVNPS